MFTIANRAAMVAAPSTPTLAHHRLSSRPRPGPHPGDEREQADHLDREQAERHEDGGAVMQEVGGDLGGRGAEARSAGPDDVLRYEGCREYQAAGSRQAVEGGGPFGLGSALLADGCPDAHAALLARMDTR